ncbi:hypothetical protein A2Y26_02710 [candidate division CPR2 bacterium GWD2_39_7]|nr:MAG: hypothetical protein A2Y26_02710 [candidate division CPR2 bacterium GWD2_39_7]
MLKIGDEELFMISYALLIIAVSLNLFLGLLVFSRNSKKPSNLIFFLLTLALSIWSLVIFFESETLNVALVSYLVRTDFAFGLITSFTFFSFCLVFQSESKIKNTLWIVSLIASIVFSGLAYSSYIIESVHFSKDMGIDFQEGPLFIIYSVMLIALSLVGITILIKKLSSSRGVARSQLLYITMGLSLSATIAISTNLIIPRLLIVNETVNRLGIYGFVFMIGGIAYAIVKHRLMDIRMVVAKSLAYTLLVIILAGGYATTIFAVQRLFFPEQGYSMTHTIIQIILAMVMAFTFQPLRRFLTKVTDKIFFKEQYDPDAFLRETNHILSTNIVLTELLYKSLDHILQQFKILEGMFVVVEEGHIHSVQSIGYKKAPEVEYGDIKYLSRFPIAVYDELEEGSRLKSILRRYETSVAVRLMEDHQFAGILFLGEKKSGDMYAAKDIQILEIVEPEITMAMQRAKQYEEIQKFNITLKAEVLRQTKKLREANDHLQELDKAKDEFISMASHQLRTPLTAIKGYLSMLLEGDAGEIKVGQFDFINEAFQGANKMVTLINDLLNVSRMSTGKFFIDPKDLDMKVMIADEVKQLAHQARTKNLWLKFECPKKMSTVQADENKIRQVIMNFIDNAIYYTEKGGVTVRAAANKHEFVFEVIDTGIGVPKEVQNKLFSKFYRADNARRLRPDGNGLGLYLAKRVVEDHGGEIIFRSSSKGSVFGFRIPIKSIIKADPKKRMLVTTP